MAILRTLAVNFALNHASFRKDVDKVDRRLTRMSNNARRVSRNMQSSMGGIGAAFAGLAGGRALATAADEMVNLRNKMGAVYETSQQTSQGMLDVKRIARESRTDLEAVGTLYQRMAVSMKSLNVSQEDVATTTQVVANTFLLSGTTAQEAANSARQFAQGLASGSLKGDEFRSVSENNVVLTQMLAEGLNMTVGQLKDFASANGLTAQVILPIMRKELEKTNAAVGKMGFTLGQSAVLIKNSFTELVDRINQRFALIPKATEYMRLLADNMGMVALIGTSVLVPALLSVGMHIVHFLALPFVKIVEYGAGVVKVLWSIVAGVWALGKAMLASPITWVSGFVVLLTVALIGLNEKFGWVEGTVRIMNNTFDAWLENLSGMFGWMSKIFDKARDFTNMLSLFGGAMFSGAGDAAADGAAAAGKGTLEVLGLGLDKIKETFSGLMPDMGQMGGQFDALKVKIEGLGEAALTANPWLRDLLAIINGGGDTDIDTAAQSGIAAELVGFNAQMSIVNDMAYENISLLTTMGNAMRELGSIGKTSFKAMAAGYKTTGDVLESLASRFEAFSAVKKAIMMKEAIMLQGQAIMGAWASAPFPANLAAVAVVTAQTAAVMSDIMGGGGGSLAGSGQDVSAIAGGSLNKKPSRKGQSHGGIDNLPSTGTYLLEKGERVVDSRLNKDLTGYLRENTGGSSAGANNITLAVNGVTDPDMVVEALGSRRGELETIIRSITQDNLGRSF